MGEAGTIARYTGTDGTECVSRRDPPGSVVAAGSLPVPHQNTNPEAAVNGRFFIGVLSGAVLVSGAFVAGSLMFPIDAARRPVEVANSPGAPEPLPEPVAEPVAAPEADVEPVADAVPAAKPAPEPEPAAATAEAAPETAPEPAPEPAAPVESPAAPEAAAAAEAAIAPQGVSQAVEPPATPETTEPATEAAPDGPTVVEGTTPPDPPTALEPPKADAAKLPDGSATTPTTEVSVTESASEPPVAVAEAAPGAMAESDAAAGMAVESAPAPVALAPEAAPAAEAVVEPEPPVSEPPATEPRVADPPETERNLLPQADGMSPGVEEPALPEGRADAPKVKLLPETEVLERSDSTFEPTPDLEATDGVIVGRLPRIGDAPVEEAPVPDSAEATGEADARPIVQFAARFENPEAKPVLALVLIDPGTADLDRAGLAALPFPVSFALDPMDPATPERAAIYRAAGKEVVMLATGIAEGAQASDIEVAFQSMAQGLPEAVAVMDLADPLFQDRRPLASLVVPVVGAQGRGVLTWDLGLNAADQVARRDDVPAAVVFRDLGSAGTDSTAIRRVLDRAVFKAGQDGRVAVAGTVTPELVAALLEWTVEGRAATVALGPVTAVLTVE